MTQKNQFRGELLPGDWKTNWITKYSTILAPSRVIVESDNQYLEWLNNFPPLWEKLVHKFYLEEVSHRIIIKRNSEYNSDFKVGKYHIVLVQQEYSKVEILEKQAVFNNIIWIVDYRELHSESLEHQISESVMDYGLFTDFKSYVNYIEDKLLNIPQQRLNAIKSGNKSLDKHYKQKMLSKIEKLEIEQEELRVHLNEINLYPDKYEMYFSENWDLCTYFPFNDYIKRFKYTASPLFLDTGTFLYYRKYAYNPLTKRYSNYLKRVTYNEFTLWLNSL